MQNLSTLVTEVVNESMSGNIHRDYERCLDVLHSLSMNTLYFGDIDMGELAGQWKEILEMKGRQLRRKRIVQKPVTVDGHTVQLVEFHDTDQAMFRDVNSDSDDTGKRSRKARGVRVKDADAEKPAKRRRKKVAPADTASHIVVRLDVTRDGDNVTYAFNQVVNGSKPPGKKRGRKPKVIVDDDELPAKRETRAPRRVHKTHYEVYFDLSSEINKANYEASLQQFASRKPEEWYCCVCFGDTETPENPYVCCSRCGCVVHKYCYGVDQVPANPSDWLCDYCRYVEENHLPWKGEELVGENVRGDF